MINEMSFRSIREERGENGSSLSGLILCTTGNIYGGEIQ